MKELIIKVVLILALIVVGISLVACAPDPDYISSADDLRTRKFNFPLANDFKVIATSATVN